MPRDLQAAAQEAMRTVEEWKQAQKETDRVRKQFMGTLGPDGRVRWPERPTGVKEWEELRHAQAEAREKSEAHEQAIIPRRDL